MENRTFIFRTSQKLFYDDAFNVKIP